MIKLKIYNLIILEMYQNKNNFGIKCLKMKIKIKKAFLISQKYNLNNFLNLMKS